VLACSIPGHTTDSGETQEETLEIEYIESVMPPTKLAALPHEEWVSSISCSIPGSAPLIIVLIFFPLRALTLLRQPLPHGFIRRCITRIRSRPDTLSHRALPCSSNHVLRHRTVTTTTTSFFHRRRRPTTNRRNRLARSHSAALAYIARRDSDDLHASRDVTLARCAHRRRGV
jgi:hypothetical protein